VNPASIEAARSVAGSFAIDGELIEIVPLTRGHIHDTFVSTWNVGSHRLRYLHQHMNADVFRDIVGLMHNIERVTTHLHVTPSGADALETLVLVPTREGSTYLDCDLGHWRTYHYIDGTRSYDQCQDAEMAHEAALAFGRFQARLSDLDPRDLREIIPSFFSSPHRLDQFDQALAADRAGRASSCAKWIEFVQARREMVQPIQERLDDGRIPIRVIHGDTKLNNVLFDENGHRARAVVDLDTCMPGYSLYDFGDLVRFTAATSREDEQDLSKAGVDLELYGALVCGYLEGIGGSLNDEERALMPFAARLVTLTIGMRFLADHLAGDVYFKVSREGHNLDRACVQFRMVEVMEELQAEMDVRHILESRA